MLNKVKKEVKEEDAYDKDDEKPAKPKPKPKKEMHDMDKKDKKDEMKTEMMAGKMNAMKEPMNAMKMNAMKMPIRKTEDLVGGQKKLDKDKDGDLDAKDFAALRKTKSEAVDLSKVKHNMVVTIKGSEYVVDKQMSGNEVKVSDKNGDFKTFSMNDITSVKGLREAVKTGEADAEPKVKELNAMVKNPMNAMKDPMNAMKDMNATYMKSNVKAPVMNNGGE